MLINRQMNVVYIQETQTTSKPLQILTNDQSITTLMVMALT